jgi:hypothetical protein
MVLGVIGQNWDFVPSDPWEHPLHGLGFMSQLLAILWISIGLPIRGHSHISPAQRLAATYSTLLAALYRGALGFDLI